MSGAWRGTRRAAAALLAGLLLAGGFAAPASAQDGSPAPAVLEDPSIIDGPGGKQVAIDPPAPPLSPEEVKQTAKAQAAEAAPFPPAQTFLLHSRPGSNRTIYLDFTGRTITGTGWNNYDADDNVLTPNTPASFPVEPFSLDATISTDFSAAEIEAIQSIWQRVSEDYAPFDVDVTTEEPTLAEIDRTSAADNTFGTIATIGEAAAVSCGCGGSAFIDVFDHYAGADSNPDSHMFHLPAFVFPSALNSTKSIAEALSHEVGHNFGLQHDGRGATEYYTGHNMWAPIMGSAYTRPVTQWSKGEYTNATTTQDDVTVISTSGAPLLTDSDNTTGTASSLAGTGPWVADGIITTDADVDWFTVTVPSGELSFTANPAPVSPNLDIQLQLRSASTTFATNNPTVQQVNADVASGLNAALAVDVPAGTYYLSVEGVGTGTATTGYTGYGSIGRYSLSGSFTPQLAAPSAPTGVTATPTGTQASVGFTPGSENGSPITGFEAQCTSTTGGTTQAQTGASSPLVVTGLSLGQTYTCRVRATNGVGTGTYSASSPSFVPAVAPSAPTGVVVTPTGLQASVAFTPGSNGGAPVTSFTAECSSSTGGTTRTQSGPSSPVVVTNLSVNETYACRVRATNVKGTSLDSADSATFVPIVVAPSAPTNVVVTPSGSTASVAFTPGPDGGSAVTSFTAECTSSDGGATKAQSGTASPVAVPGLDLGKTYVCHVSATNSIGTGPTSVDSASFVPAVAPSPPTGVTATPSGTAASVAFTPGSNGGATVTSFDAQCTSSTGGATRSRSGSVSPLSVTNLGVGHTYTCRVRATNAKGTSAYSASSSSLSIAAPDYVPETPVRLLDTRTGLGGSGFVAAGSTIELTVAGVHGVPSNASAVVFNLTSTQAAGAGHVIAWPCGVARPDTSALNFVPERNVGHFVVVPVGTGGKVCLYAFTGTHLVADLFGWHPATSDFEAVTPMRLLDTRSGLGGSGFVAAGSTIELVVAGANGVPADASSVVLNLTSTQAQAAGHVIAYPCGVARPDTSSLNFVAGQNVGNLVVLPVGSGGRICLYAFSGTHLVADLFGWNPAGSDFEAVTPARLLDTRSGVGGSGFVAAGQTIELTVTGANGVPPDAKAVVVNLTSTQANGAGHVIAWPCGVARPDTSSLNFVATQNVGNLVVLPVGSGGKVCLYAFTGTHLVADLFGWHPA